MFLYRSCDIFITHATPHYTLTSGIKFCMTKTVHCKDLDIAKPVTYGSYMLQS